METQPPRVAALLAAGGGSRFGGPTHKLEADLDGRPMWMWALDHVLAAGFDHVVVVTGAVALPLPPAVIPRHNDHWGRGQAGSVQLAVAAARELGATHLTIGLADQPFITTQAWRAVADAPSECRLVVAVYDGIVGPNPVRLRDDVWQLLPTSGDSGARDLLRAHPDWVCQVDCVGSGADIDTQEDLALMEKLLNEFIVNRPIDTTWAVLTDVERIAPCLPGAQLQEIEGDEFRGVVKVKLGPVSAAFKGQAVFLKRDDAGHRAVLKGEGRDTGGKGNASALITAELESVSADVTRCKVSTDLQVTGKMAQFGRGIMADVSEKLMNEFATNLNAMLAAEPAVKAPVDATTVEAPAEASAAPQVRTIHGPAAEPIELSDLAGGAVLKRLLPLFGGLVILLLALRRLRK